LLMVTTTVKLGGSAGTRTRDQRIKSPLLYQLSYRPQARYYDFLDYPCQINDGTLKQRAANGLESGSRTTHRL